MKLNEDLDANALANLGPTELLQRFAIFKHYQLLGKCLGYNPKIEADGNAMPLDDWNYDSMDADCQKCLNRWTASKQAAPQIAHLLFAAGSSLWGPTPDYPAVLREIANHLKLDISTCKTDADIEQTITAHLLRKALEAIEKLPEAKKKELNAELEDFLQKQHVELGSRSALEYLYAGGVAGVGTLAGTQIAAGIILSHLGIWHGLLFAVGLWVVPTAIIAWSIFAPLSLGALVYVLGKHNFKKTIPTVAIIAALRQEAMLRIPATAS